MARKGFYHARGPSMVRKFGAKASSTIAIGDLVIKDDATGYVDIAVAASTSLLGVAVSAVSSATAGDAIYVECHPDAEFIASCSGTSSQALVMDYVDMEGATTAMQINENASSTQVLQLLEPVSAVGASAEHYVKIARHTLGEKVGTTLAADIGANSVDSAAYVDGSIDPEHTANVTVAAGDGFPLIATATYADAGTVTITMTRKCRVVDFWIICTNATAGTVKLTDTDDNDITDALTHGTTDKAIVRVGTIDDAHWELAAAETLKVVSTGSSSAAQVFVTLLPVA